MLMLAVALATKLSPEGFRVRHEPRGFLSEKDTGPGLTPGLKPIHALISFGHLNPRFAENISNAGEGPRSRMRRLFMEEQPTCIDLFLVQFGYESHMPDALGQLPGFALAV